LFGLASFGESGYKKEFIHKVIDDYERKQSQNGNEKEKFKID